MSVEFTVVIPTYNRANFVQRAIRSVIRQTYSNWKILIIDDASTDKTEKVVQKYLYHPNVFYHRLLKNVGISKVLNEAMNLVTTNYMVQLDSDDWLPRKALQRLANGIIRNKEKAALYYGNIATWKYHNGQFSFKSKVVHRQFKSKYSFLRFTGVIMAPRCYKVSALKSVGGWDTSDKFGGRYMEDRRIILRLIERYKLKWINKTMYNRTKHEKQLTNPKHIEKRNHLRKRTIRFYLKRWGNKYKPIFGFRNKYVVVKRLVKRKKK
ncbi:glycosyltransferase family 2 protein [Brevibacillus sp. SYSU BS000544]|uniref:glycosyltransferase family 2 protein n=1 Tax=Brevibacillus sp. SYSU BS000544 TaxID=3416443 RepID=UPI003CE5374C